MEEEINQAEDLAEITGVGTEPEGIVYVLPADPEHLMQEEQNVLICGARNAAK